VVRWGTGRFSTAVGRSLGKAEETMQPDFWKLVIHPDDREWVLDRPGGGASFPVLLPDHDGAADAGGRS
jgi:hypothetical protein